MRVSSGPPPGGVTVCNRAALNPPGGVVRQRRSGRGLAGEASEATAELEEGLAALAVSNFFHKSAAGAAHIHS